MLKPTSWPWLRGFVGGFSYILVALPEIGGRPVPTVPCLRRGHHGWNEALKASIWPVFKRFGTRKQPFLADVGPI